MSDTGSVTVWLQQLRVGEASAAQRLWEAYFQRLVGLAHGKLRPIPRASADEEDVALSAFDSFYRGVAGGRFPQLEDRDDLWQILFMITERKAYDLIEREGRQKRDWRRNQSTDAGSAKIDLAGREPDPAFAAQVRDQCQRLLDLLGDDELRLIAVRKMEGYTNPQIAKELNCTLVKVERRLRLIRREWESQDNA